MPAAWRIRGFDKQPAQSGQQRLDLLGRLTCEHHVQQRRPIIDGHRRAGLVSFCADRLPPVRQQFRIFQLGAAADDAVATPALTQDVGHTRIGGQRHHQGRKLSLRFRRQPREEVLRLNQFRRHGLPEAAEVDHRIHRLRFSQNLQQPLESRLRFGAAVHVPAAARHRHREPVGLFRCQVIDAAGWCRVFDPRQTLFDPDSH